MPGTRVAAAGLALLSWFGALGAVGASSASPVDSVRNATAGYRDVARAEEAGYRALVDSFGLACIDKQTGGIGIQFVNPRLEADAIVDPARPEGLLYEPMGFGRLRFNGVEYIVDKGKWDAAHSRPPTLFGRAFRLVPAGNRFGIAPFYELRAWIWSDNPLGVFGEWSSKVGCDAPPRIFN